MKRQPNILEAELLHNRLGTTSNGDTMKIRIVDNRKHSERVSLPANIPALETGSIVAMGVSFDLDPGYRQSISVERDIIIDQDNDGSWSLNVYRAGQHSGGGLRFGDECFHGLFKEIMTLFFDPDRYGDQDVTVAVEKGTEAA